MHHGVAFYVAGAVLFGVVFGVGCAVCAIKYPGTRDFLEGPGYRYLFAGLFTLASLMQLVLALQKGGLTFFDWSRIVMPAPVILIMLLPRKKTRTTRLLAGIAIAAALANLALVFSVRPR